MENPDDKLALLDTFPSEIEAYIAKGVLETNGIPAIINDTTMSSLYGGIVPGISPRIYVYARDLQRARDLLLNPEG